MKITIRKKFYYLEESGEFSCWLMIDNESGKGTAYHIDYERYEENAVIAVNHAARRMKEVLELTGAVVEIQSPDWE